METILSRVEKSVRKEFDSNKRILTYGEYLSLVEQSPAVHLRGSAQYIVDMMEHFGRDGAHFKLFDMEFDDPKYRVIGLEDVQVEMHRIFQGFAREGIANKLVLLHGPNGSAKSSILNCMLRGLEHYSHDPAGAVYRFNWIFPVEKVVKGSLGLATHASRGEPVDSYAKLAEDDIAAKVPCELKDHPILLLPTDAREEWFEELKKRAKLAYMPEYLTRGALSHKSNQIFESLLTAYKGDLKKVLMHVQVERFYMSKRYRSGAVTIEPQMHVDAQARQVTMDRSLSFLPPSLQSLSLYELSGDLVDANRGMVEFADILKRPVDTFKYLLIACESGTVNVGPSIAPLDIVYTGSTNELQLDAFKEFPDFISFKARIELVRVPYLLKYSQEQKIYDVIISKIAGGKHVTPHTTYVAALWAVLSRLKKPNPAAWPSPVSNVLAEMTPLEKSKFYDHGEVPGALAAEEKKHLKAASKKLFDEYSSVPYYEGRTGASAREMKAILYAAAANPEYKTLSPLSLFRELEEFVKRTSEYEFLRQDIKDGYHDCKELIDVVKQEYLGIIDREVRESMGLIQVSQVEDFLKKYVQNLSAILKKEKVRNNITGKNEDPDMSLLEEFEKSVNAPQSVAEKETFRNNVISAIGAYALDNPGQPVEYGRVFPEFLRRIENQYFDQQKSNMKKIGDAISLSGTDKEDKGSEHHQLAQTTIRTMISKFGYSEDCAAQTIQYLIRNKY